MNIGFYPFVSDFNQKIEGGRLVKYFFVLPQGFRNLASVFSQARWHI